MLTFVVNSASLLSQGNPETGGLIASTFMVEQYLDGDEVDVDLVLSDGQPVYTAITDNWPTMEPYVSLPTLLLSKHVRANDSCL